jgi:hypothetical protein
MAAPLHARTDRSAGSLAAELRQTALLFGLALLVAVPGVVSLVLSGRFW